MTKRTKIFIAVSVLLLIGLVIFLVTNDEPASPAPGERAESSTPITPYVAMARGRIDVEGGIIQLAANQDGVIKKVLVEEGDRVIQGQVLAIQDTRGAKLRSRVAEAEVAEFKAEEQMLRQQIMVAEREVRRLAPLVADGLALQRDLDEATDQVKLRRTQLLKQGAAIEAAAARKSVADYDTDLRTIRAPLDGQIVRRLARPGDGVSTLNVTTLFWFVPNVPKIVRAELEEQFVYAVSQGMHAEIVPESDASRSYPARLVRIGKVFGPKRSEMLDPKERADVRVVECILKLEGDTQDLLLGQRVIVQFPADTKHGQLPLRTGEISNNQEHRP